MNVNHLWIRTLTTATPCWMVMKYRYTSIRRQTGDMLQLVQGEWKQSRVASKWRESQFASVKKLGAACKCNFYVWNKWKFQRKRHKRTLYPKSASRMRRDFKVWVFSLIRRHVIQQANPRQLFRVLAFVFIGYRNGRLLFCSQPINHGWHHWMHRILENGIIGSSMSRKRIQSDDILWWRWWRVGWRNAGHFALWEWRWWKWANKMYQCGCYFRLQNFLIQIFLYNPE